MKTSNRSANIKKEAPKKKRGCFFIFSISFLVLLLSFCVLLYIRHNAWFGNIPEEPYTLPPRLDRVTLTPGEDFMTDRTISWRYDTVANDSKVEYYRLDSSSLDTLLIRVSALGKNIKTRAGRAYYYHTKLSELEEGATYRYRVISGDKTSEWKTFKMPSTRDTVRFLYIGDVQDPDGLLSDSLFSLLRSKKLDYDFLSFGGDQIERPMDRYWNIWYKSLGEWAGSVPMVMVAGNHEYIKGFNKVLDSRWVAQHNFPENGPEDFKGKSYYVDFPLMRMIILDSNVIQWPGGILQHQEWLEKILQEAPQPWKIVMFHHGVHSVREGRMNPLMHYLFLPILNENGADLVLQGHDHAYSRITTKVKGDSVPPVFIISSSSPKQYRNGFDPIHDRLASGIPLYQSLEITKEYLKYQSFLFDGTPYDDLLIKSIGDGSKKVIDNARDWDEIFEFDSFGDSEKGKAKRSKYKEEVEKRKSRVQ